MLGFLKNQYEFANKTLGQVDLLQKTIDGMRKVTDTPPTGKVTFGVGITNIGDADGVIQKVGQLKFDPYELPLYCDEFTVVRAHSFMRIRFNINEATDKADALKNWKEAVLRNDVPKYLITLNLNSEPFSKFSDDK